MSKTYTKEETDAMSEAWTHTNEATFNEATGGKVDDSIPWQEQITRFVDGTARLAGIEPRPIVETQDTKRVRKSVEPVTKLANNMANEKIVSHEFAMLDVAGNLEKARNKDVRVMVSLEADEPGVELTRPIEPFDREVYNAVVSNYIAGNRCFSTAQVWHTMHPGRGKNPTDAELGKVGESLDTLWRIRARIDFTEQLRGRKAEIGGVEVESGYLEGHLLEMRKAVIRTANGRLNEGWVAVAEPILYTHARNVGEVATYDIKMLDTESVGNDTEERFLCKKYLIRRIAKLNADAKARRKLTIQDTRVKFDTIFKEARVDVSDRRRRSELVGYIEKVLNDWKEKKFIRDWSPYNEGRRKEGVDIAHG